MILIGMMLMIIGNKFVNFMIFMISFCGILMMITDLFFKGFDKILSEDYMKWAAIGGLALLSAILAYLIVRWR